MKRLLCLVAFTLAAAASGFAQVQQPSFQNYGGSLPARINGVVQVSAFDYDVPSDFATGFATWTNFSNGCSASIPGFGSSIPFSSSATVKVNDLTTPANTETVALTAFSSVAPTCSATLSTSNAHTGKYRLQSGTCGLKEAVLLFGGAAANYELGQMFYDRGCSASTITSVTGAASGSVLVDKSNASWAFYVSNGANFVKQLAVGANVAGALGNFTQTIGSGNVTTAGTAVAAGACQAQTGITVTGAAATDTVTWGVTSLPATWQTGIQVIPVVTANTVTVNLCNPTAGSITPAANTVQVRVVR